MNTLDLVEVCPDLKGDTRFLPAYFLPDRARYRRAAFEAALDTASDEVERARLLRVLGRPEAESALAAAGDSPRALAYRGESRLVREPLAGLEDIDRALAAEPKAAYIWLWRGYGKFLTGDWPSARSDWERAAALDPAGVTCRILSGIVAERSDDLAAAQSWFTQALALDPDCAGLYTLRAIVSARSGRWDEAIEDGHRAVGLHPENLDGLIRVLSIKEGLGRLDPATEKAVLMEVLDRALRGGKPAAWLYALRAEAAKRAGFLRMDQCIADLERAVALEPERAWLRAFLARALTGNERSGAAAERALREAGEACRLDPERGWLRAWKAEIAKGLGREAEAVADLDAAIALDGDYRLAHAWRGAHRLGHGDPAGAADDFTLALDLRGDNAWTLHQRAMAHRAQGRHAEMLADLRRAVAANSRYVSLHAGLQDGSIGSILDGVRDAFTEPSARKRRRAGAGAVEQPPGAGSFELLLAFEPLQPEEAAGDPLWRGRLKLNAGDPGAIGDLRAAPPGGLASLWLGEALVREGRYDEAEAAFAAALSERAAAGWACAWSAGLKARLGDGAGCAAGLLEAARRDPPQSALYLAWASLLGKMFPSAAPAGEDAAELALRAGDPKRAVQLLADAASARGRLLRGLCVAQSGDESGGKSALSAAAAEDPAVVATQLAKLCAELIGLNEGALAAAWPALARACLAIGRVEEARQVCDRLLNQRPGDAEMLGLRGETRLQSGDAKGAAADYAVAAAALPQHAAFWNGLGQARLAAGEFEAAVAAFDNALQRDASLVLAWVGRGLAHKERGRFPESAADLERARSLAPELFAEAA